MATLQVQQMPHGYDVEAPSFFYWCRAGVALTLGAAGAYVVLTIAWLLLLRAVPGLYVLRMFRVI